MKKQFNKYYIAFFYLCSSFLLFAQPGSGNGTGDLESADALAAPINDYLWVLVLGGLIFVFIKFKSVSIKMEQSKIMIPLECKKCLVLINRYRINNEGV